MRWKGGEVCTGWEAYQGEVAAQKNEPFRLREVGGQACAGEVEWLQMDRSPRVLRQVAADRTFPEVVR